MVDTEKFVITANVCRIRNGSVPTCLAYRFYLAASSTPDSIDITQITTFQFKVATDT